MRLNVPGLKWLFAALLLQHPSQSQQAASRVRRVMSAFCEVTRGVGDTWATCPTCNSSFTLLKLVMQSMRLTHALISHSRQIRTFFSDEVKYRGTRPWACVVDERTAQNGQMIPGCRRSPGFPPKPNYYFLAHLHCSLKFACKFIPCYLH